MVLKLPGIFRAILQQKKNADELKVMEFISRAMIFFGAVLVVGTGPDAAAMCADRLNLWRSRGFSVVVSADQVRIGPTGTPGQFLAWGALAGDVLEMAFYTRSDAPPYRVSDFSGSEIFSFMIHHFAGRFRLIKSSWHRQSDNLREFNRLTADGILPERAALLTWSGRQADSHGFREVCVRDLEGGPGAYTLAVVYYTQDRLRTDTPPASLPSATAWTDLAQLGRCP